MNPVTHSIMTADQLLDLQGDGLRHELIHGELTNMTPAGKEHGKAAAWICHILVAHIAKHALGDFFGAETGFLIAQNPDTVLAPDFAFVGKARVDSASSKGFFFGAPDLAVEVLSPSDRAVEVDDKIQLWLNAGCRQVWIVNIKRRTITIHQKNRQPQQLQGSDQIPATDLLPGLHSTVDELFPPV